MLQYRAIWTTSGGRGYSVFNAREVAGGPGAGVPQGFATAVRTLFPGTLTTFMPDDVSIGFDDEVLQLSAATGELEAVFPVTAPAAVSGSSSGAFHAAGGARVDWLTSAIVRGRRLRGRTFMVPLAVTAYAEDGTLASTLISALENAAQAYLNAVNVPASISPAVWSRPLRDADGLIIGNGTVADITGRSVPDQATVLRSRRD